MPKLWIVFAILAFGSGPASAKSDRIEDWNRESRGLFSVVPEKKLSSPGKREESLGEFLFRYRLLALSSSGDAKIGRKFDPKDRRIRQVSKALGEMIRISASREDLALSLEPRNIRITYTDSTYSEIESITLYDTGECSRKRCERYSDARNISDYSQIALDSINKDRHDGKIDERKLEFKDTQKNRDFLSGKTLSGEKVRVAGLTDDINETLLEVIHDVLAEQSDWAFVDGFFYGSRVMPRSEVNKRNKKANFAVKNDGVTKSYVRDGGLTSISDLEMFLILKKVGPGNTGLSDVREAIRKAFGKRFMRFPLGIKMMAAPSQDIRDTFDLVREKNGGRGYTTPPEQYVRMRDLPACKYILFRNEKEKGKNRWGNTEFRNSRFSSRLVRV